MDNNWIVLLQQQTYLAEIMETNQKTARFGLVLSRQDSEIILKERNHALQQQRRVEFGLGITTKIIYELQEMKIYEL